MRDTESPWIRETPGSGVSTPTFFYIGTLAIFIVMLVSWRCHAESCLSQDVFDGLRQDCLATERANYCLESDQGAAGAVLSYFRPDGAFARHSNEPVTALRQELK